jgi:hypothetical protein
MKGGERMLGMQQITIYAIAALLIAISMTAWLLDAQLTAIASALTQRKQVAWRGFVIFLWATGLGLGLAWWGDTHAMKVSQSVEQTQQEFQQELQRQQAEWERLFPSP